MTNPVGQTAVQADLPIVSRDDDFYTWAMETARAIRCGRSATIDWESVAEEIEDMGRSERRALESRLAVLIAHLLKWRFQPAHRSHSWSGTIKEQRRGLERLLRHNPGLRALLDESLAEVYPSALALAERDTGMDESSFPPVAPWTAGQILDESYWP